LPSQPGGFRVGGSNSLIIASSEVCGVHERIAIVLLDHLEARPRLAAHKERLR
jgi:hypothetical protein